MKIEQIEHSAIPLTVDGIKKLAEDPCVFVVVNVHPVMKMYCRRVGHDENWLGDVDHSWRMKPLSDFVMNKDPLKLEVFVERIICSNSTFALVRLSY